MDFSSYDSPKATQEQDDEIRFILEEVNRKVPP